jgi:hypothetical protein
MPKESEVKSAKRHEYETSPNPSTSITSLIFDDVSRAVTEEKREKKIELASKER